MRPLRKELDEQKEFNAGGLAEIEKLKQQVADRAKPTGALKLEILDLQGKGAGTGGDGEGVGASGARRLAAERDAEAEEERRKKEAAEKMKRAAAAAEAEEAARRAAEEAAAKLKAGAAQEVTALKEQLAEAANESDSLRYQLAEANAELKKHRNKGGGGKGSAEAWDEVDRCRREIERHAVTGRWREIGKPRLDVRRILLGLSRAIEMPPQRHASPPAYALERSTNRLHLSPPSAS